MAKYHITAKGEPGLCRAHKGACPLGDEGEHYPTKEEAAQAFEKKMVAEALPTASKRKTSSTFAPDNPKGITITLDKPYRDELDLHETLTKIINDPNYSTLREEQVSELERMKEDSSQLEAPFLKGERETYDKFIQANKGMSYSDPARKAVEERYENVQLAAYEYAVQQMRATTTSAALQQALDSMPPPPRVYGGVYGNPKEQALQEIERQLDDAHRTREAALEYELVKDSLATMPKVPPLKAGIAPDNPHGARVASDSLLSGVASNYPGAAQASRALSSVANAPDYAARIAVVEQDIKELKKNLSKWTASPEASVSEKWAAYTRMVREAPMSDDTRRVLSKIQPKNASEASTYVKGSHQGDMVQAVVEGLEEAPRRLEQDRQWTYARAKSKATLNINAQSKKEAEEYRRSKPMPPGYYSNQSKTPQSAMNTIALFLKSEEAKGKGDWGEMTKRAEAFPKDALANAGGVKESNRNFKRLVGMADTPAEAEALMKNPKVQEFMKTNKRAFSASTQEFDTAVFRYAASKVGVERALDIYAHETGSGNVNILGYMEQVEDAAK